MKIFSRVKSPSRWLAKLLSHKRMSQRQLAAELQRDPSQVNKWFNDKEPIPSALFICAATAIDPRAGEAAVNLWCAYEIATVVLGDAPRGLVEVDQAAARQLARELVVRAEDSALDGVHDSDLESYAALRSYLTDAQSLLQLAAACQAKRAAFIAPASVERHLRFPFNTMGGDLLAARVGRTALRQKLLSSMRQTALSKEPGTAHIYSRQHAYHMLSRYGAAHDGDFVRELTAKASDLHTRRTVRYAEVINAEEPLVAERFVQELSRDAQLSKVTLEFDFVHYGDQFLFDAAPRRGVHGTVRNYLRRAQQRSAPGQICLLKLCHIIHEFGLDTFQTKAIRPRVEGLLTRLHDIAPHERTAAERRFIAIFGTYGHFQPSRWQQLELTGLSPSRLVVASR